MEMLQQEYETKACIVENDNAENNNNNSSSRTSTSNRGKNCVQCVVSHQKFE